MNERKVWYIIVDDCAHRSYGYIIVSQLNLGLLNYGRAILLNLDTLVVAFRLSNDTAMELVTLARNNFHSLDAQQVV